jgi:uncharacterized protein YdeI (YjbR/CyaY-like superfamily)
MTNGNMNPEVDEYLGKAKKWQQEMTKLRAILLGSQLTEEFKWGKPCYTFQNSNVVMIIGFEEYCALSFLKGALLKDPDGILVAPGEHSQAARQIRFTSVQQIVEMEPRLTVYIDEAIGAEKAGLKVDFRESGELTIPEELQGKFDESPALKTAFDALTPGRQRAYVLYFTGCKQSKSRASRIEKCMPQILEGKGLRD